MRLNERNSRSRLEPRIYGWHCHGRIFFQNIVTFFPTSMPVFRHCWHWITGFNKSSWSIMAVTVGKTNFLDPPPKAKLLLIGAYLIFSRSNSSISSPRLIFFSDFFRLNVLNVCLSHLFWLVHIFTSQPCCVCIKAKLVFFSVKYQETSLCSSFVSFIWFTFFFLRPTNWPLFF